MKVIEVSFETVDCVIDNEKTGHLLDRTKRLKLNGPYEVDEIDSLIKMVVEFKPNDDYSIGYYGIREHGEFH